MTDLGLKRKDLYDESYACCGPCCPDSDPKKKADWDNQIVYPEVSFEGKAAEMMGAGDCELGDEIEVTLRLRVKELRDNSRVVDGKNKRDLRICFDVLASSDATEIEGAEDTDPEAEGETAAEMPEGSALGAVLGK